MVRWADPALPKDFGGIGLTDTRVLNSALLDKWLMKIESSDKILCVDLLRRKYMQNGGVFQHSSNLGSQFWKGIMNVRRWMKLGSEWSLGDGSHVWFWHDVWLGPCPLKVVYSKIFEICNQ
jgi:hypothetical protein